jgi:hypothetical protein
MPKNCERTLNHVKIPCCAQSALGTIEPRRPQLDFHQLGPFLLRCGGQANLDADVNGGEAQTYIKIIPGRPQPPALVPD